jgi:3-dehydroquinate synthase
MRIEHHLGSTEIRFQAVEPQALAESWVVTDSNVAGAWPGLVAGLERVLVLPPGESTKSMIWLERVCSWLASTGANRRSRLAAVGGGVIGDLAGFAAASYMRGIEYVQVPTTLLAQVDSSVGGKVAIDLPEGKNLVGAFYPPSEVLSDIGFLHTLDVRQFRSGMAEVCKYGFVMDSALSAQLCSERVGPDSIGPIVHRCVALKKGIVEEDEFETKGLRAILNFGHTIGHAIEQVTEYRRYLHGEAIAIGMIAEARLGVRLGVTPPDVPEQVRTTLANQGIEIETSGCDPDALLAAMRRDKKVTAAGIGFSLLTEIGGCKLIEGVGEKETISVLEGI